MAAGVALPSGQSRPRQSKLLAGNSPGVAFCDTDRGCHSVWNRQPTLYSHGDNEPPRAAEPQLHTNGDRRTDLY
jgi:hypothetical protein